MARLRRAVALWGRTGIPALGARIAKRAGAIRCPGPFCAWHFDSNGDSYPGEHWRPTRDIGPENSV